MLARIVDNKIIKIEQISPAEEDIIYKAFSAKSPRAAYIDTSAGLFDGWYRKYNMNRRTLSRPFLGELRAVCKKYGLPLSVVDDRPSPKHKAPDPDTIKPDLLPGITLDDHQVRAIKAACRAEVGCIQHPTGSGKSEIIAGITKVFNCPTAIICGEIIVIEQLKARLELREIVEEVGLFCSGERPNGQKVIAGSIQSLTMPSKPPGKTKRDTPESYQRKLKAYQTRRQNAHMLRDFIGKCDLLLIDEADRSSSAQYKNLFRYWFKGRRRYGFSATCYDPDKPVENLVLKENLGSIISYASRKEVEAIGRIIPVTYAALVFGDPSQKSDKMAFDIAEKQWIIENEQFHKLVSNLAIKTSQKPNYGTLVLVESRPLGYKLESMIPNSCFICGDTGKQSRREAVRDFEERKLDVLIGGKIIKRGLDLKGGCETLIIATGGKLWSDFDQKVGRAVRKNAVGYAKIYDFFFLCNHYLYSHSRRRLKHIVAAGYPAKVIFKHVTIDARKFIKSRFRIPK